MSSPVKVHSCGVMRSASRPRPSNLDTAHAFINEAMGAAPQAFLSKHTICGSAEPQGRGAHGRRHQGAYRLCQRSTRYLKKTPLKGIPPRELTEHATYDEWVQAYQDLKSGI